MRKLPVFGILSHALRSVINNIRFAWHVSWPWLIILVPVNFAVENILPQVNLEGTDAATVANNSRALFGQLALGILSTFVFSSVAVNWHRYILMDEVPRGMARMRVDNVVWRYFGNTLLVIVLAVAASIPLVIIVTLLTILLGIGPAGTTALSATASVLVVIPLFYRLMVKLPAIAIGNTDFTLKSALEKTTGNTLQFCLAGAIIIVSIVLMFVLLGGVAYLLVTSQSGVGYIASLILQQFVSWLVTIFTVTFLTSLYGFFVEGRDF